MSSVEVWSDFDGTAVEITGAANPRNWSKYPLAGLAGYNDFLKGIRSTGVDIAGVVSRRPDVFIRRMATAWSISRLGFTELPTRRDQIVHTAAKKRKGGLSQREAGKYLSACWRIGPTGWARYYLVL